VSLLSTQHAAFNRFPSAFIFRGNVSTYLNDAYIEVLSSDMSVELAIRDDCFLTRVVYLMLELKANDKVIQQVNLVSPEATAGVWDADNILIL
jgi:hypothetical protein